MKASKSKFVKPAKPVFVLPLNVAYPSIRQAALAILDNTAGEEVKPSSVCGRISRIVNSKSRTGSVFGFTVTRGVREARGEEE